ncbi:MAG: DUF2142 domain-containing protein [Chloroflexota bacterium]|nr:DUF2142 domain-containing protein [Chloroflexota bacterium]MDQ5866909.1 DUF2142 domain-containing protein [Chloroflexota bacterium]
MTTTVETSSLPWERVAVLGTVGRWAITPLLRWLVVLAGLFALLISAYSSVTHWRSDGANAVSTPLVSGTSIGQTFVSRYPNLSALEVRVNPQYFRGRDDGATLVMHLREAPGNSPHVAISTLHVTGAVEESQYQRFTFPPIADSQDKTYYVEIESPDATPDNAPALLWWIQFDLNLPTDTYPGGTAYLNGQPQQSDLAFGLRYDPSPLDAFRGLAQHAAANVPKWLIILFLAAGALASLYAAYTSIQNPKSKIQNPKSKILSLSLPIALGVALANGVLFSLLVPPWQGPDEHGHYAYAALLYRQGLDDDAVQRLEWQEGGKDHQEALALKAAVVASMAEHNWTRLVSGHPTPGAPAFPQGGRDIYLELMWQIRQPAPYYWLCAISLHVANAVGAGIDPFVEAGAALRVMRFVSVLLNLGVVALAWLAGVLLGGRRLPWLRLALPLGVALLPMHTFIASVVSNDVISDLAVTALFVSLVALLKWPYGWRGVGLAALSVALLGAGAFAKLTALVSGGPLLGLGLLVWLGLLLTRHLPRWRVARLLSGRTGETGQSSPVSPYVVPAIVAAVFLMLCVVTTMLLFRPSPAVAGWQVPGGPSMRPDRVQMAAHDGAYAIEVPPGQTVYQWVDLPWPHPPYTATLTFWAQQGKDAEPGVFTTTVESRAELLQDRRGTLSRIGAETLGQTLYSVPITPTRGQWQQFSISNAGTNGDRKVWVRFTAGSTGLYVDDVSLAATPLLAPDTSERERNGMPQEVRLRVFNPSMETGSLAVSGIGARILRGESLDIIDVLVNPQAFDKVAIWQRYAYRQFRSFWGNFGWLSIPLPEPGYGLLNVLILLVLVVLTWHGVRRLGSWTPFEWLGLVVLLALVATVFITFARMMGPLSTSGVHTDPQGRYLFGYTVPVLWLIFEGLNLAWSWAAGLVRRANSSGEVRAVPAGSAPVSVSIGNAAAAMPWGTWLWCATAAFFAGYCLLVLVVPYYYR